MGLRLAEGIDLDRLAALAGAPVARLLDPRALARFVEDGWLAQAPGRLSATAAGRQRLNGILGGLLGGARAAAAALTAR